MEETILPSRLLVLIFVPVFALVVSSIVLLVLWPAVLVSL
jgi:hypothetical protein